MLHLITTLLLLAVAVSSSVCAQMTRPDRNYYPMQRVLWSVLGGVYGGAFFAALFAGNTPPAVRVLFTLFVLGGTSHSILFMRRRNRTPRFVPIDDNGHVTMVSVEALREAHTKTISYLRHGAMPAAWVQEVDEARKKWQELEDWRAQFPDMTAGRRARERGVAQDERGER